MPTSATENRLHESTVLLVEDNPDDVLLIQRAFRKAGIVAPLQTVTDGEMAMAYLEGSGAYVDRQRYPLPVLVLLDWKLPRKNGLEVLGWIRARADLKEMPVVVLTSSREPADIRAAYGAGANSYLLKPVDFAKLLELVQGLGLYWLVLNVPPQLAARP
jgi:CheY-like chemotaxis protein